MQCNDNDVISSYLTDNIYLHSTTVVDAGKLSVITVVRGDLHFLSWDSSLKFGCVTNV